VSLKAPFPYFGGKSGAANLIWSRFGNTPNYVEPFAGSLAVLLNRPHHPKTETVNDADGLLSNAWRAIRLDPDAVARHCDHPVVEVDLHARHIVLTNGRNQLTARLEADPEYYDAKLAGWWIWGLCNKIGGGWCSGEGPWRVQDGLLIKSKAQAPGITRSLPHLGDAGKGISRSLPHLGDAGTGDTRPGITRSIPHLGNAGKGDSLPSVNNPGLYDWMQALSTRLRRVRICCGDWTRVTGDSVTTKHGMTAVLLDPPYAAEDADNDVYGTAYSGQIAHDVRAWAIQNGTNPLLRIALCGYDGNEELAEHGWTCVPWKARKGYQTLNEDGGHNGHREAVWFSPACLRPDLDKRVALFAGAAT
jgi:DNA adenine methylase